MEKDGVYFLLDFWVDKYLKEYIREGGSKIKFVTGREGSGKTWFLRHFADEAQKLGYVTASFSAEEIWLHDFRNVYLEILEQCDLDSILKNCADEVVRRMGDDPAAIPEGQTYLDYLSGKGEADGITRRALRIQLKEMFLQNPMLDNNFALACSLMTGGILGHPALEPANREILMGWLHGDKTIKLSMLRALGLSPMRITKYNARHMLRSLAEVIRLGGQPGLVVTIDDLDILQSKTGNDQIRYTKMRREDTYESIRQLIDDIDTMQGIMFVYGFDRILLDNENSGVKSYQALWMRIQNEIHGARFNRFADIADLDQLAYQEYTAEYLVEMSGEMGQAPISLEEAQQILESSRLGGVGVPAMVKQAALVNGVDAQNSAGAEYSLNDENMSELSGVHLNNIFDSMDGETGEEAHHE